MYLWLHKILPLLLAGEIPQSSNAGAVQGAGAPGSAANPLNAGTPGAGAGVGSGPGVSTPPEPVPAPPGVIQPTDFYQLDPNDPDSRLNGIQLREGFARVRQFDQIQSQLHRQQNELQREQTARQTAETELRELKERDRLASYMQGYGIGTPAATPPGPPGQPPGQSYQNMPPAGQQPGVGGMPPGEAADDWLMGYGVEPKPTQPNPYGTVPPGQAAAYNAAPGTGTGQPPSAPGGPAVTDPRQIVDVISTLMDQKNTAFMSTLQGALPGMVENSVGRRFAAQHQQDGVRNQFSSARVQLNNEMQSKYGISPERSRDLLDKFYLSLANNEEASRLMNAQYQDPQTQADAHNLAQTKLAQANMFFSSAINDAVSAAGEANTARQQQDAREMLMTGSYAELGDLAEPNREVYDPVKIEQMNRLANLKAQEIATTQNRLQTAAGVQAPPAY